MKYRYGGALLLRQCSSPASWKVLYRTMAKCESPPRSTMNFSTSLNLWMLTLRPVMYVVTVDDAALGRLQ